MAITVPLRLSDEIVEGVDEVIDDREGAPSRNAVLREMIVRGLKSWRAEKGKK